jgi:hypothetical protein
MLMKLLAAAIVVVVALVASAEAGTSEPYARGGRTIEFQRAVEQYNQTGELFRIIGHCQSACTMFLAARNVCIEPGARLLFHAGENDIATSRMFNSYNPKLKAYLTSIKAMETPRFHTISGSEIISRFGYRACPRG